MKIGAEGADLLHVDRRRDGHDESNSRFLQLTSVMLQKTSTEEMF
jgi:hypothetical protein